MYDIIINVPSLKDSTILFGTPWDAFLPPLVGSFAGVVLGILFGVLVEHGRKDASKFKQMKIVKNEIEKDINVIKNNKELLGKVRELNPEDAVSGKAVSILLTDSWDSSIYVGALKLFSPEELVELTEKYKLIGEFNSEIKRYRDVKLNIAAMYNMSGAGSYDACRRYEESIFPKYHDDMLRHLEELNAFLEPRVSEQRLKFWRYIL